VRVKPGWLTCAAALLLLPWDVGAAGTNCDPVPLPRDDFTGKGMELTWDCARFEGDFVKGRLQKGKVSFSDGEVREGTFSDGASLVGPGKRRLGDGTMQEGVFENGYLRDGEARITLPDGRVFEGWTRFGRPDGYGTVRHPDGSVDRGYLNPDGEPFGFVIRKRPDGSLYVGEYREGKPFGDMISARPDGTGEIQAFAWGGQPVKKAGDVPKSAGPAPAPSGTEAPKKKDAGDQAKDQVINEVNRAFKGLKGVLGGG